VFLFVFEVYFDCILVGSSRLISVQTCFFGFVWIGDEFGGIVDVCFDKLFGKLVKWVVFFGFLSEELEFSC
jgi:hypothetical protein